jgi:hypothetical protein
VTLPIHGGQLAGDTGTRRPNDLRLHARGAPGA